MHLDSFTNVSVVDLKKSMRNESGVLNALKINSRVSTFDLGENAWLINIIESLVKKEFIVPEKEPYPWCKWRITEAGIAEITT